MTEAEKVAELMKERYKIIADYPYNNHGKIGTILDRNWSLYPNDDETQKPIWSISDFPHLFKKLEWWEERKVEEMPEFILSSGQIYKVLAHHRGENKEIFRDEKYNHPHYYYETKPATESEYNNYNSNKP